MDLYIKRIKTASLLVSLTILSGCGGAESSSNSVESLDNLASTPTNKLAIQKGQIIDNSGLGIEGVTVSIGNHSTNTDENGYYTLKNLVENKKVIVSIKSKNGPAQSTIITVNKYSTDTTTLSPNYLKYTVDTYENSWENESQKGASGSNIIIPSSGYLDVKGNIYNGSVKHQISTNNVWTTKSRDTFPGTYEGINSNGVTVPFVSFGLISVDLSDKNGNNVKLSDGMSVIFHSAKNKTDETIPLWHYDYAAATWREESIAYRQEDGTYKGEVQKTGTWSLSKAVEGEPGIYRGRLVYENGNYVKDARVSLVGKNWIQKELSTDANGIFEIKVVPKESFELKAYNYKWKYGAVYPTVLPAVKPGEVIEDKI